MTANDTLDDEPPPMVLVMQDDPILAMIMSEYVEEAGCEALVVRTADAAIRVLDQSTDIRVVFADLDVRGSIMGLKLMAIIRDRWPPIELVLTGALAPDLDAIPARGLFYGKPFNDGLVVAAIRGFAA